jgi:hypothetical protein
MQSGALPDVEGNDSCDTVVGAFPSEGRQEGDIPSKDWTARRESGNNSWLDGHRSPTAMFDREFELHISAKKVGHHSAFGSAKRRAAGARSGRSEILTRPETRVSHPLLARFVALLLDAISLQHRKAKKRELRTCGTISFRSIALPQRLSACLSKISHRFPKYDHRFTND